MKKASKERSKMFNRLVLVSTALLVSIGNYVVESQQTEYRPRGGGAGTIRNEEERRGIEHAKDKDFVSIQSSTDKKHFVSKINRPQSADDRKLWQRMKGDDLSGQSRSSRTLQDLQSSIKYRATFSVYSAQTCSGWLPYVEIGCLADGSLTNVEVTTTTEPATCQPHPVKGASYKLCGYSEISQSSSLNELIFATQIQFSCSGALELQLVAEATTLDELELQCTRGERSIPVNAVALEYFDRDLNSFVEDFECTKGTFDTFQDSSKVCLNRGLCDGRCFLPSSSARLGTPVPPAAIQTIGVQSQSPAPSLMIGNAPTKSPVEENSWQSVRYEISASQSASAGCYGFDPVLEFGCINGGRVSLLLLAPITDLPVCTTLPQGDTIRCSFPVEKDKVFDNEFAMSLAAEFECVGKPDRVAAHAFIRSDNVTCPSDPSVFSNMFNLLSIRYYDNEISDYKKSALCSGDSVDPAEGSDRTFCFSVGVCDKGQCNIPRVSSEQITPIPENGWVTIPAQPTLPPASTNSHSPTATPQRQPSRSPVVINPIDAANIISSAAYMSQSLVLSLLVGLVWH